MTRARLNALRIWDILGEKREESTDLAIGTRISQITQKVASEILRFCVFCPF
jgi:hypothetical protein